MTGGFTQKNIRQLEKHSDLRGGGSHHAGVVVGLLGRVHQVKLGQVSRESLGAVDQQLLQAG